MRTLMIAALALFATPALAQFPPPGIYACVNVNGGKVGTISLLVAGDYQWDPVVGDSVTGQIASAGNSVEAVSGALAKAHWMGGYTTEIGETVFVFKTDEGQITCGMPKK